MKSANKVDVSKKKCLVLKYQPGPIKTKCPNLLNNYNILNLKKK